MKWLSAAGTVTLRTRVEHGARLGEALLPLALRLEVVDDGSGVPPELAEHLLLPGDIPVVQVDRGGQVTYHGPGQLVAYLLLDVRKLGFGVRDLVSRMERCLIELLASYGVTAVAKPDAPGVYVNGAKIASLGLRIRHGCSFHGLALNVDMDLEPFRRINPCGYAGLAMTQLRDHTGPIEFAEVSARLRAQLVKHLDYAEQTTLTGGID